MRTLGSWQGLGGFTWPVEFADLDEELRFLRKMVSGPDSTIVMGDGRVLEMNWRARPEIRDLATQIIRDSGCPQRDKKCQAIAIGSWVQENIYYVHELPERFQTPRETLRTKSGDCDDGVTLICSLLESIGIRSQLVCMKINGNFSHIFPAAIMEPSGTLLPLDWTMRFPVSDVRNPIAWAHERGKTVSLKLV